MKILNNSIVKCRILTTDRPRENLSFYLLKAALFMAFSIVSSVSGLLISSLYGATELRAFSITMVILGALEFGIGIAASVCCCLMKPCTCCCCVSQDEVLFVNFNSKKRLICVCLGDHDKYLACLACPTALPWSLLFTYLPSFPLACLPINLPNHWLIYQPTHPSTSLPAHLLPYFLADPSTYLLF